MSASAEIRKYIKQILENNEEIYAIVGTASNINEDERTCDVTPVTENAEVLGVRLQASLDSAEGFVCIPKTDSIVIVTFLNKNTGFVSVCTEVEKVLIDTPETIFNGGDNGGLININDLVSKINDVENALNSLISSYNSHTHQTTATIGPSPAPGVISPTTSQGPNPVNNIAVSDIEDGDVTH